VNIKEKALEYVKRGWSIIPIEARSKESHKRLLQDTERIAFPWRFFAHNRAHGDQVIYWFDMCPDANVAVVCGGISGVVVLDIDTPEALAHLRCLLPTGFVVPTVKTSRGEHWYFKYNPFEAVQGSGPGWDIRSDEQYALLPPSTHPSGVQYEWLVAPGEMLPDMPLDLLQHLKVHAWLDECNSCHDDYPDEDDDDWEDEGDFEDLEDDDDEDLWDDEDEDEQELLDVELVIEMCGFKESDFIVEATNDKDHVPLAIVRTAQTNADGEPVVRLQLIDDKAVCELDKEFWGPWDESLPRWFVDIDQLPDTLTPQMCRTLACALLMAADKLDEFNAEATPVPGNEASSRARF
jgi:hypothetical protein